MLNFISRLFQSDKEDGQKPQKLSMKGHSVLQRCGCIPIEELIKLVPLNPNALSIDEVVSQLKTLQIQQEEVKRSDENIRRILTDQPSKSGLSSFNATALSTSSQQRLDNLQLLSEQSIYNKKKAPFQSATKLSSSTTNNALSMLHVLDYLDSSGYVSVAQTPMDQRPSPFRMAQQSFRVHQQSPLHNITIAEQDLESIRSSNDQVSSQILEESPIVPLNNVSLEDAVKLQDDGKLDQAFQAYLQHALNNVPIGFFLVGLSLLHGWGCTSNELLAFSCLVHAAFKSADVIKLLLIMTKQQKDAESQVTDTKSSASSLKSSLENSKREFGIILYEIGQCYRFGQGVIASKSTALYHLRLAADAGDIEAQITVAKIYNESLRPGNGRLLSSAYYRLAASNGRTEYGTSWIYKRKYCDFFSRYYPEFVRQDQDAAVNQASNGNSRSEPSSPRDAMSKVKELTLQRK
ncbi:hypothetical protein MIR68_004210 [Amoeboaphelidium protococcarum]|nr:hypothetical protein MIR68_004210 [Amoeboaphelidium protococcarum]